MWNDAAFWQMKDVTTPVTNYVKHALQNGNPIC